MKIFNINTMICRCSFISMVLHKGIKLLAPCQLTDLRPYELFFNSQIMCCSLFLKTFGLFHIISSPRSSWRNVVLYLNAQSLDQDIHHEEI